jgi:methylmalonyl-CoA mutase, C-terminal domain
MQRKIRVLVGKPGLDGHDRGAKVVAAALRDAGMEVIYTGLHQTPGQIVEAAIQEDVDVVALSILSGAHMTLFPEVLEHMRDRGLGDRLLTGGGIIPPDDMKTLATMGVGQLFGPGASTQDIAAYIHAWFESSHGAGTAAALVTPRPPVPIRFEAEAGSGPVPRAAKPAPAGAPTSAPRPAQRAVTKRAVTKRAVTKRAVAKRAVTKRAVAKRAVAKRAATKRAATKRRAAVKARVAVKKRAVKKRVTRRAVARGRRPARKRG